MDEIKMEQCGDNSVQIGEISGGSNIFNFYNEPSSSPSSRKNEGKPSLPDDDPVSVLIDEADDKTVSGDYAGAVRITQRALTTAERFDENDPLFALRIANAKLACVLKMRLFPQHRSTAIEYITDILALGVFDKYPEKMFRLHYSLADISVLNNDLSTARAAIQNARSLVKDDFDTMHCNDVEAQIAVRDRKYDEAIALFQKIVDVQSLKITTKTYKDNGELFMLEQNMAATLNNIAIAYRNNGNIQQAMVYVKKAVDIAQEERLEYERAIFSVHWADMLFHEALYDLAIEKASVAREILKKRNETAQFSRACEIIGAAYCRQEDLVLSRETYLDALDVSGKLEDKLHFLRKVVQLDADLGDEQSLNERLSLIRKIDSFSNDRQASAFENWAERLRKKCRYVVPNDFSSQPGTFFMFDEDDADFQKLKRDMLEFIGSTKDVNERNEKVRDFLIRLSDDVSKRNSNGLHSEDELTDLLSQMNESEDLREKAQLMYEIGVWYYDNRNEADADKWFLRAMEADGASNHTIIWSKITHAQVLMFDRTEAKDNEAKAFLDEAWSLVEKTQNHEAIAFCNFNRGRLEARKGNFEIALDLFMQAYTALYDGKIDKPEMRKELDDRIASVKQHLSFENNPDEALHTLQTELRFLQTWYPEYSQQLTEYWWHYRAKESLNNVRVSGTSACAIFSDNRKEICWYSEALRSLFAHCLFAPKENWVNAEHGVTRILPVPCNTPFPYSVMMVNDQKKDGKVYGYHLQADGTERRYAYTRIKNEKTFDYTRTPEPITMSYIGYCRPNTAVNITPMTDDFGSCRWWVGADYGGSPIALMNLLSRFDVIPVFWIEDVNTSDEITILRSERIDIPFITDEKKLINLKRIQKELRRMTSLIEKETMLSAFDALIDKINDLQFEDVTCVSIHLAVVRFGYRIWDESPVQWRTYPMVIINLEDEWRNSQVDDVISKSVAIRDAICLAQKIPRYDRNKRDSDIEYIEADALRMLELSTYIGDDDLKKVAKTVLRTLDEVKKNDNEAVSESDNGGAYGEQ